MPLEYATITGRLTLPDAETGIDAVATFDIVNAAGGVATYSPDGEGGGESDRLVLSGVIPPATVQPDGTLTVTLPELPQDGVDPASARWRMRLAPSGVRAVVGALPPEVTFELVGDTTWDQLVDVSGEPVTESLLAQVLAARNQTYTARDTAEAAASAAGASSAQAQMSAVEAATSADAAEDAAQTAQEYAGTQWFPSTTVPTGTEHQLGDWVIHTPTSDVYKKTGPSTWTLQLNIRGAAGQDGTDGTDGVDGQDGADGAPGQDGADGQDGAPGSGSVDTVNGNPGPEVILDAADVGARPAGDVGWAEVSGKPETYPPAAHGHAVADITDLVDQLAGKAPLSHAHLLADLPVAASGESSASKLVRADDARLTDARTPVSHAHAAEDVTSGTLTLARLPVAADGASSATALVRADDTRLANARTPAAHAASHGSGQADALSLAGSQITSGQVPVARLGTGSPDASKVLRGDGAWAAPAAGGGVLASLAYSAANKSLSAEQMGTTQSEFDATNLSVTFTPVSAVTIVHVTALVTVTGQNNRGIYLGLRNPTSGSAGIVAPGQRVATIATAGQPAVLVATAFRVATSPGTPVTWRLAGFLSDSGSVSLINTEHPCVMEVVAA